MTVSIDQIVSSVLLKNQKSIHFYAQYLKFAAEAVRELQLSHLPLVNHTILTKESDETWFRLPDGFTDWVQVGIRIGERWRPIAVSDRLMPYPNSNGEADFNSSYNSEYKKGEWTSWLQPVYRTLYGDYGDDFFNEDYLVDDETASGASDCCESEFNKDYPYRKDVVTFNTQLKIIMCPKHFPCNSLYLTYIAIGQVDTMTHIPIQAQSTIEAYVEWKYHAHKRNVSKGIVQDYERLYYNELRLMRARMNPMTTTDIAQIMNRYYGQQNFYSTYRDCYEDTHGCCATGTAEYGSITNSFSITLAETNLINGVVYDYRLAGKTLSYIVTDAQYYNSAFWTKAFDNDFLTSDTLTFYLGQTITFVLQ